MARFFDHLTSSLQTFIQQQPMFFVATAGAETSINLSPKGMDSFRILDDKTVFWLNYTGSGNETSAHLLENNRMTIMFCSFGPKPLILRLYGQAREIGIHDLGWEEWMQHFPTDNGARQIFIVDLERVQTSCGYAVPEMDLKRQRTRLLDWSDQKGPKGIAQYWEDKNRTSIDGKPTKYGKEQ